MIENILNYFVVFIMVMSAIVCLHELGHYLAARFFKLKVTAFAVGLGPTAIRRTDKRGTEWRLCVLPFGGYVQFGSIDNNPDGLFLPPDDVSRLEEFQRTIYGTHPLKRIIVFAAGPFVNILITFFIFICILWQQGAVAYPLTVSKVISSPYELDIKVGDVILRVNDDLAPQNDIDWTKFYQRFNQASEPATYLINRGGSKLSIDGGPSSFVLVDTVFPRSPAFDAGLSKGDFILNANGKKVKKFSELSEVIKLSNGEKVTLEFWRDGKILYTDIVPKKRAVQTDDGFTDRWLIGVAGSASPFLFDFKVTNSDPVDIFLNSIGMVTSGVITSYYHLKSIIVGAISTCNLGGPIGIAEATGDVFQQSPRELFFTIAMISLGLAFLNLLPIPPFDGFQIGFSVASWIVGPRVTSQLFKFFSITGAFIMLALFFFVSWNDIFC